MSNLRPEDDVQADPHEARTRATGGEEDSESPDHHSTTGSTPNDTFVGRVSGADPGAGEETGAERRAQAAREAEEGGAGD